MRCKVCTSEFIEDKNHKFFCSYVCFLKHSSETRRVHLVCKNCKQEYSVKKNDYEKNGSSFCSRKCKVDYGHIWVDCSNCKKRFYGYRSRVSTRNTKNVYCSKECKYEHRQELYTGKNNPNYRNGLRAISKRIRNLAKAMRWKLAVIAQDKNVCQKCKQTFLTSELEAHHKVRLWKLLDDYPNEKIDIHDDYFFQVSNGMTLCEPCHKTTYGKDEDEIE